MGSEEQCKNDLHILFFPFMAPGHIIPTMDMAKLFVQRGVKCTVVTTAACAAVASSCINNTPGIEIHIVPLPSSIDVKGGHMALVCSLHLFRPSIEATLRELSPTAVVADMFFPWATDLCAELGMPRLLFSGTSTFTTCAKAALYNQNFFEVNLGTDGIGGDEAVMLDGFPHRIQLLKTQLPGLDSFPPPLAVLLNKVQESEDGCYGELFNSFYDLEPEYARYHSEVLRRRAWFIGPVSLCNDQTHELSIRGAADSVSPVSRRCQEWLDCQPERSVLYICFGSLVPISTEQLREISLALESVTCPFLWVVRDNSADEAAWLTEVIAKKEAAGECLIVRGWAPQVLILNHASTGGFVTHCGWNSSLESLSAGVPMVTWPLFADQFYNERLIVDVLMVGIAVGSKYYEYAGDKRPVIAAADVKDAIERLMGDGEEAEARRQRVKELGAAARRAVMEDGSSSRDIDVLIEELRMKN